jgi:hypothetical protein
MDYKPNSHRSKEEQKSTEVKKVEKVVKGTVKTKKKSEVRKLTDAFISEDAANVKSYVWLDVIIPTIKKTVVDIVTDSIHMIFLGTTARGKSGSSGTKINYSKFYDPRDDRRYTEPRVNRNRFDYDDLIFESRGEAEAVLDQMEELIDRYHVVTVADMYDMADMTAPYTSNKYGWSNLRNAEIVRVRDGYIIKLPRAMVID